MQRGSSGVISRIQRTAKIHETQNKLEGVLIEGELKGHKASCSGFVFGDGRFVLTQGALISALQIEETPEWHGELLATPLIPGLNLKFVREKSSSRCGTQLVAWWSCPLLTKSLFKLRAEGWKFSPDDSDIIGCMLVLSVGEHNTSSSLNEIRKALLQMLKVHVIPTGLASTGRPILLESTPFASGSLFLNSWTKGIVSAVTGDNGVLILCDAHAAPGCEGGALYAPKHQNLLGIVVLTFCIVRGEAVTLCVCAALGPVLGHLLRHVDPSVDLKLVMRSSESSDGVALLRHGASWASAVALQVNPAIFLTCSHVFEGVGETTLQWTGGGPPRIAKVLFRNTHDAFDLAVVQTHGSGPKPTSPDFSTAVKGEEVVVSGYGVLTPAHDSVTSPLVSRGNVSHVCPEMLQTTCTVLSGASGGAVLRASNNQLLGIIVGNMRALNADPLPRDWPRINFAVPVTTIAPVIQAFIRTGDVNELRKLKSSNKAVQSLWRLDPMHPSKL